jgi:hypothetical protein
MNRLSKIIDGAEDTRYNLEIAVSVANEAAKYLEKNLNVPINRDYLAMRQDDVLNLFSAASLLFGNAKKSMADTLDLLYELDQALRRRKNEENAAHGASEAKEERGVADGE